MKTGKGERIAKVLARAGLCSRRDAEKWIADGRVSVNGETLASPARTVIDADVVLVDGQPLPARQKTRLWRHHKPRGLVTTHKDEKGRPTVFSALPAELGRVVSVGRLDINSEGLLLLTNDGELARSLEHPSRGWIRKYRVRVHGRVDPKRLATLKNGVTVDGVRYGEIVATLDETAANARAGKDAPTSRANSWLTLSLREGKNREVRRVMEHLGLTVTRLIRVSYGPFLLGRLEPGETEEVPGKIVREQTGGANDRPKQESAGGTARAKPRDEKAKFKTRRNDRSQKDRPKVGRRG